MILRTAALPPIEGTVRRSRLFRPLVGRFIAGNDLSEALVQCEKLSRKGLDSTLDYLGENTHRLSEAERATDIFVEMVETLASTPALLDFRKAGGHLSDRHGSDRHGSDGDGSAVGGGGVGALDPAIEPLNISIKLTQCGLDLGLHVAEANYRRVLVAASDRDQFVRVDMEGSAYTQQTLDLVLKLRDEFPQTGTVLQSYLYRTDDDVARVIAAGLRVRLVKGAYLEPASVAYPEKHKVDEAFVRQAKALLKDGYFPAIATHDEAIVRELKRFADAEGIGRRRFEFQMLYGIRRDLQEQLHAEGYRVRVYVPFGDQWYPYFTRRHPLCF